MKELKERAFFWIAFFVSIFFLCISLCFNNEAKLLFLTAIICLIEAMHKTKLPKPYFIHAKNFKGYQIICFIGFAVFFVLGFFGFCIVMFG